MGTWDMVELCSRNQGTYVSRDRSNDTKVFKTRLCDLLKESENAWKFDLEHNGITWVPKSVVSPDYEPDNAYVGIEVWYCDKWGIE